MEIESQLYGKKLFDIRNFEFAVNDLLELLVEINNYLQLKPYRFYRRIMFSYVI